MNSVLKHILKWLLFSALTLSAAFGLTAEVAFQNAGIDIASSAKPAMRVFTIKDGLPQSTVQAITFDRKGYLWVGTQNGAAYYNGQKWTTVDLPNKNVSKWVTDILAASDGSIWFSRQGEGISMLKDGQWTNFNTDSGLPNNTVFDLMETASSEGESVIWAATGGGIARLQAGKWTVYDASAGLPNNEVFCLLETNGSRTLWAGTAGGLARLEAGKWTVYDASDGLPDNQVKALLESADEDGERVLWVGTNGGLGKLKQGKWTVYDKSNGLPDNIISIHGLLESVSRNGERTLWVGTFEGGLARLRNNEWTVYNTKSGLPDNSINSLYESISSDGRRTVWVGTVIGLAQIFNDGWIAFDESSGLPNNVVMDMLETVSPNGERTLWAGTYGGGLARRQNGEWTVYNTKNGLPSDIILSLLETKSGDSRVLWAGTYGGGLTRLENGRWTVYDTKSGLPSNDISSLLETIEEDGSFSLWAGTSNGLARLHAGKWTIYNAASGLPNNRVNCLLETVSPENSHSLWAGTEDKLARLEKGKWTVYDAASGLPGNSINSLMESVLPDGRRALWVGTRSGVSRMDLYSENPRLFNLSETTSPALPENTIYQIREDARHRIYLFTNKGIARLTPRESGDSSGRPYDIYTFTTEDGLPSNECNHNGSMVDSLGRICAGTMGGAAMFDPSKEIEDRSPKPLYIERTILDGKERALANASLSYKENNITFEFALLSFFREKDTRYRTQLEGFDEKPSEWTARFDRVYTNLSGGDYVFKVWGRDYAGNISGPQEIAFKIRPAPWRTWWAYMFYAAALAGAGYSGHRYRFQVLEQRNRELEAKVLERTEELANKNEALAEQKEALAGKNDELAKKNEELSKMNSELVESHKRADRIFSALADALPDTVLDGKYRIGEKIGSGGFGAVFRATHLAMKRSVAVKIFKPAPGNDSAEALDRFQLEAVSACRINHPNAVAVLDSGISSDGIAYLVMELLEGRSLTQELREQGALSLGRAAQILYPVCSALAKAHASGIVHRDIKPDNIFLHRAEEGEVVKLVDFGIAKLIEGDGSAELKSLTGTGGIIGTPTYMAPERFEGKPYDGRSDVYSLGIVLYEMLCGAAPFQYSREIFAIVAMHLNKEPQPLREINPKMPEAIDKLVLSALSKSPEKRPAAMELGEQFLAALEIDPARLSSDEIRTLGEPPEELRAARREQEMETVRSDIKTGMTAERMREIGEMLQDVLNREPQERSEFLDNICTNDQTLKRTVEMILTKAEDRESPMSPERWRRIEEIFLSALEIEPNKREAFIEESCAGDASLKNQVEAMIAAEEEMSV